jgi:60 kDa SS-A/Ro ribonucleoprotein
MGRKETEMSNALGKYAKGQSALRKNTPLDQRTPGRTDEVKNNAGSYVFGVSDQSRLERFLILGVDGGTYYVGERKLTEQNVKFLKDFIARNERAVLNTVIEVSESGRAFKNTPALFALALILTEGQNKAEARAAVPRVARTSTHLFELAEYLKNLGGWGRAKRAAIVDWYESMDTNKLAYQAVKYRQRNGWSHRDLFRLAHPKHAPKYPDGVDSGVGNFILGKTRESIEDVTPDIINGFKVMQAAGSVDEVKRTLEMWTNLPWETIPTKFLKDADVWKTLFYNNQLEGQALVRNITRLARIGAFKDMVFTADYAERLADEERIAKTRLHPINFLNAVTVHQFGQIDRDNRNQWYGYYSASTRKKDWTTASKIVDALTEGFYTSFKHVKPSGRRTMVAVDVSGSMTTYAANGLDLSAAQVAAAMGMTIARTEKYSEIVGFSHQIVDLGITANTSLETAMRKVQRSFGATDISAAIDYAIRNKIDVDTFALITDNETNRGRKPTLALADYRQKRGIESKLASFGVAATEYTVADPKDPNQMDFVGFDSNAPRAFADFSAGRI